MVLYVHEMATSKSGSNLLLKHALSAGYFSCSASKTEP